MAHDSSLIIVSGNFLFKNSSDMLENNRWRPPVDSIPHMAVKTVEIGGVTIPAGTSILGMQR